LETLNRGRMQAEAKSAEKRRDSSGKASRDRRKRAEGRTERRNVGGAPKVLTDLRTA